MSEGSGTKKAMKEAKAPPAPASDRMLDRVPASAIGALIVRESSLQSVISMMRSDPEGDAELGAYMRSHIGVDILQLRGAVFYVIAGQDNDWAAFFLMDAEEPLPGTAIGRYRERGVWQLSEDPVIYGSVLADGIAVGTPQGLTEAMDLAAGEADALGPESPLGVLASAGATLDAEVVLAATFSHPAAAALGEDVQRFGLQHAFFAVDGGGNMELRVRGSDPAALDNAVAILEQAKGHAMSLARASADETKAGEDPWEGAGAIVAYHRLRSFLAEVGPVREGNDLVARYAMPDMGGSVPLMGLAAALAVPSFTGYMRRANTSEATANLEAMFVALEASHRAALEKAGKSKGKRRRAVAKLRKLRIKATPDEVPCEEVEWTPKQIARFEKVGFAPEGPQLFRYEVGSPKALGIKLPKEDARGTILVLRAAGDQDCDQELSTFDLYLSVDEDGNLQRSETFRIDNEIE